MSDPARPNWAPTEIDLTRPSASRVYDYYLGGVHNFAIDRQFGRKAIEQWPDLPAIMQENRAFLRRAVRFCVRSGIRQFLDLGSGIPTRGNVHEVAQLLVSDVRVAYVDLDPVAVAHSRIMLAGNEFADIVPVDLRDPVAVLAAPQVQALLDLSQPVVLMMVGVLHFVPDEQDPAGIVAGYRDRLAAGSALVLSHATHEARPTLARELGELYERAGTSLITRTRNQVAGLMSGFELVDPGVVRMPLWRPDVPLAAIGDPERFAGFAGVGFKV